MALVTAAPSRTRWTLTPRRVGFSSSWFNRMDHGERRGEMQWSRRWRDLQMTSSRIRLIELPLTGFIALTCAQSWHFLVHRHRQDGCVQPSLGIRCQSAPRTRPYNSTWNIPAVFHEPGNQGNSPRKRGGTFTQPQRTNCPQPTRSHIENGLVKIER